MKAIYKLCASVSLCSILLISCTDTAGESPETGFHAEGELYISQAQVLTGTAQTRGDLTHLGGSIWISAYDNTSRYALDSDGTLSHQQGNAINMPRTDAEAKGLVAYGHVSVNSYNLPIHVAPANYPVVWNTNDETNHTATLTGNIALAPAVAALNITLQNSNNQTLQGFDLTGLGIYNPADPADPTNWVADDTGTYQIKPTTASATGRESTDLYTATATLTPGQAMLKITGRSDAPTPYQGKTWIANTLDDLTALEPGKRYNLTVTLNGDQARISINNITDWSEGTAGYLPNGYNYAVYTWQDLVVALENVAQGQNIIQMADITCPDNQTRTAKNLPSFCLYNGNGHTITGLKAPLFNWVQGDVYNLHLRQSEVRITDDRYCGLLANESNGTITLCSATGTLTVTTIASIIYAGGLVGGNDGPITRCYTDCRIENNEESIATLIAGGLVGDNMHGIIVACAAFGTVQGEGDITKGNLVGENYASIYYSYATADGNAIGINYGIFNNSDPILTYTLVADPAAPTGIARKERTFNGNDPGFWTDGTPPTINFGYEGKP